jgi:uncharacterized protein
MGELKIPVHDLDALGKDFVFALDASWLEKALEGSGVGGDVSDGPGEVRVHAQRNGTEILVHGQAEATLVAECVRCLRGVPLHVACDLAALYAPGAAGARESSEDDEDLDIDPNEPDREFYQGDNIMIDDLVRDYLLLELPMQPRCEEGACAGLDVPEHMRSGNGAHSTAVSGERGVDPRLAALQKIAPKGESDKE